MHHGSPRGWIRRSPLHAEDARDAGGHHLDQRRPPGASGGVSAQEAGPGEEPAVDIPVLEPVRRDIAPFRNPHASPFAKYDHLGRKQPHRLSLASIVLAIPGMASRTRRVPARAIVELAAAEEGSTAMLHCPCGGRPVVTSAAAKCRGCERYYFVLGDNAFVICGEMTPPSVG